MEIFFGVFVTVAVIIAGVIWSGLRRQQRTKEAMRILRESCGWKIVMLADNEFYIEPLDEVVDAKRLQRLAGTMPPVKR